MTTVPQTANREVEAQEPQALVLSHEQIAMYREMIAAGVAIGRKKASSNPKMDPFIFSYSRGVALFDVAQTAVAIDRAAEFLKALIAEKRSVLVVGSQATARELVKSFSVKYGFFSVTTRWLGGLLTNFKTISERITYFKKLKVDKESGALLKYTKKEQLNFARLIDNLEYSFSGVEFMLELPAALFVVDALAHDIAVREAKRLKIPIIAIMNNDNDPREITYPIPANDNSLSSLQWIFKALEARLGQ